MQRPLNFGEPMKIMKSENIELPIDASFLGEQNKHPLGTCLGIVMMNRFLLYCITLIAIILISGCSTRIYYFSPAPQQGQTLVAMQHQARTKGVHQTSNNMISEILFEPTAQNKLFNDMVIFHVYAKNVDAQPMEYSIKNITLVDKKGKSVPILDINKVVQKFTSNKSKAEMRYALGSWFQASLEMAVFSNSQTQGTVSGYNSQGQYFSGTYQATATDPSVVYSIYRDNSGRIEKNKQQLDKSFEDAMLALQRLSLSTKVLDKGQSAQGIIAVPLSRFMPVPNEYKFTVLLGNQPFQHSFIIKSKP